MSDETEQLDSEPTFDWGNLGEAWLRAAAASVGASVLQLNFASGKHAGLSNAGAARTAGYRGDEDSIRKQGYRAFRTTAVQNLLALAAAEAKGGTDGTVDGAEARRILSRWRAALMRAFESVQLRQSPSLKHSSALRGSPNIPANRNKSRLKS